MVSADNQAAQFGRAFLDLYNPNDFVAMAHTLKVLNAVRYYEIGIPITYDQYTTAGPPALITRLLTRNQHLLALRISQYLGLRPDPVLKHWAAARIMRSKADPRDAESDAALCDAIVDKFESEGEKGVSYAEIAKKAWEAGRVRLATMVSFSTLHNQLTSVARPRAARGGAGATPSPDEAGQDCAREGR
jgi:hypothetical protein